MRKLVFIIIICTGVFGCKQTPAEKYEKIADNRKVFDSFTEAFNVINSIPVLELSSTLKQTLSLQDSVVTIRKEKAYMSNFQIFNLKLQSGKPYSISIKSYCDCFGSRKFIFYPEIAILDQNGAYLQLEILEEKAHEPKWTTPIHLERLFRFSSNSSSDYTVFVYSNNSILNKELIKSSNAAPIQIDQYTFFVDVPYQVKAYPVGRYQIKVETKL